MRPDRPSESDLAPSTPLLAAIQQLSGSIDQEHPFLTVPLTELAHDLKDAIGGFVGFEVTVFGDLGLPVTLTDFDVDADPAGIRSSLRVALASLRSSGSLGFITFYSDRAGAFVDLAADLGFALGVWAADRAASAQHLSLDEHLQPENTGSRLTGLAEASAVNRAIGVLVGQGRALEEARAEFAAEANRSHRALAALAEEKLRSAELAQGNGVHPPPGDDET